jgi:hypothetical protein
MHKKENSTSSTDSRNTDLLAISPHMHPAAFLADATVSCPMTPAYVLAASASSNAILDARAKEKSTKHQAGATARGVPFFAFVWTHSGAFGPDSTLDLLRAYFSVTAAFELAEGHYNPPSRMLYSQLWHKLQISLARSINHSISSLVVGPPT